MQNVQAGRDIYTQVIVYYSEQEQKEIEVLVNIHHLPQPTTALIGRKTELAQLTEAFTNGKTRLAIIVAAGGIGKSALTDEWLQQIAEHNYYGKTRVFAWSFYSQGSHNTFTNSQPFFDAALKFFKKEILNDEFKKAELLAECLQQYPCLLILDGLEPLQYAENLKIMNGELQDKPLSTFLFRLRFNSCKSFVLLSSRQPLVELKKWQAEHFLNLPLATLPHSDGAKLLDKLGVKGNDTERQAISQDLNGHALSLVLMGHLLKEYHDVDPRYANELNRFPLYQRGTEGDFINTDAKQDSRHALRVLDYYDSLQDAASRCFLHLLGLFDRPMQPEEKRELIAKADHAAPLRALTDDAWKKLEQRLENNGLLLGKKGSFGRLEWDTHPIIRAYFGEKFKTDFPEKFRQANFVLFDYYQNLPEKEFPDTLEEMLPLYRAVVHGCLAGKYLNALYEIFENRIIRGQACYSVHQLGAVAQDLTALAAFFPNGWTQPLQTGLTEEEQASLLGNASFYLMSLGRLQDAIEPRLTGLTLEKKLPDWQGAANSSQNLVDLYIPLGQITKAQYAAEEAIQFAQNSGDITEKMKSQSSLAKVLHHCGNLNKALRAFQEAEFLERSRGLQYLSSLCGFNYCDLLLNFAKDKVDLQRITVRAKYSFELFFRYYEYSASNISKSFYLLIFAKIAVAAMDTDAVITESYFKQAIINIEIAKMLHFTPPFYLYRADFYLTQNQLEKAAADLNSALEIIERCGMKLYQVDYCLIHGRYSLAIQDFDTALNHHYIEAKNLIQETGYHLRDAELDLLAALICYHTKLTLNTKDTNYYLQKAKNRIEEIGQWGLMPRWETLNQCIQN